MISLNARKNDPEVKAWRYPTQIQAGAVGAPTRSMAGGLAGKAAPHHELHSILLVPVHATSGTVLPSTVVIFCTSMT